MEKLDLIGHLASSQNRRDEVPNQQLAQKIITNKDAKAVKLLMELLISGTAKIKKDCIKVSYEIGETHPELIAPYVEVFLLLLESKDNRLQWGAMTALDCISSLRPELIFENITKIISTAEGGSVITKDHAIEILVKLGKIDKYNQMVTPILIELLAGSAVNQFPKYAESIFVVIKEPSKVRFRNVLLSMLEDLNTDAKRKRVQKILKKMQ